MAITNYQFLDEYLSSGKSTFVNVGNYDVYGKLFAKEYICNLTKKESKDMESCVNNSCHANSPSAHYNCKAHFAEGIKDCADYIPFTAKKKHQRAVQLQRELDELSPEVIGKNKPLTNILRKMEDKMSLLDVVKHETIIAQRGNAVIAIVKETLKAVPMSEELHAMIEKPGISDALIGIVVAELYKAVDGSNSKVREALIDARTIGLFRLSESVTIVNDLIAKIGDAVGKIEMLAKSQDVVSEE